MLCVFHKRGPHPCLCVEVSDNISFMFTARNPSICSCHADFCLVIHYVVYCYIGTTIPFHLLSVTQSHQGWGGGGGALRYQMDTNPKRLGGVGAVNANV